MSVKKDLSSLGTSPFPIISSIFRKEKEPVFHSTTNFKLHKNIKRETPCFQPSLTLKDKKDRVLSPFMQDPYLQKFERISGKLEKIINEVHKKYCFGDSSACVSPVPLNFDSPGRETEKDKTLSIFKRSSLKLGAGSLETKSVNKIVMRSKVFQSTSKWIPESPR